MPLHLIFIFCARRYTALELFNVITNDVAKFTEWNNIMADFISLERKNPDLVVKF